MRRSSQPDPLVVRELEALDAALAGERSDPGLELIAAVARADAPGMPPGLALRLEEAAAKGFPRPARRRRAWPGLPDWAPVVGGLAAALAALVVAASALDGGTDERATSSSGSSSQASEAAPNATAGDGGTAAGAGESADSLAAPPAPGLAARSAPRRVRRAADLTITTPLGRLQDTSDAVSGTADRLGGHVQRSRVSAGDESGEAFFALRIPTARLEEALAELSRLGHVRARSQASDDITARFDSARSRLGDARAERQALLRALAEATTAQEIASIDARLEIARSRIAAARADLSGARRTAALARVGVTVVGVAGDDGATGGDGRWTPGQALEDAVGVLSVAAGVAIVSLAAVIPAAVLALLALPVWRAHRRRRRELALEHGAPAV